MRRGKKNYNRGRKKPKTKSKKPESKEAQKNRNASYVRRSKAAEEALRKQKELEANFAKEFANNESSGSEDEHSEDAFQDLMSAFPKAEENGHGEATKRRDAIESSDDSDENEEMDEDEELEELDEEEIEEDVASDEMGEEEMEEMDDEEEDNENMFEKEAESEGENVEDKADDDDDETSSVETDTKVDIKYVPPETEVEVSNKDVFNVHYFSELENPAVESILNANSMKKTNIKWPSLGCILVETPTWETKKSEKPKIILSDEEAVYAKPGTVPDRIPLKNVDLTNHFIVNRIVPNVHKANGMNSKDISDTQPLSELQSELLSVMTNYQDMYFSHRTLSKAEEIRFVYCLHTLNHALKCRSKVVRNNAKLTALKESDLALVASDKYKDQGLVRPRILILVPFRDSVFKVVNNFISILYGDKKETAKEDGSVINYKRFEEEFTGDSIRFPKQNPKPEDYEKTFCGNTDDTFRIGLAFTKKCIKLYTEFYSSDVLIASPLGLRMIIGAEGDKDRDYDFLSSLEILVLDQGELFFAQNWDHLLHVLNHLHLKQQSAERTDFSRARRWCLNGFAKFYRQSLLFTSHELPEFRSLYNKYFTNYRGKIRTCNPVAKGTVGQVSMPISQIFHKIEVLSLESSFDTRFKYFIKEILPQYRNTSMAHCLIYVPSYFDYVRLRNYFKEECINFVQINEYTKDKKIARARDMFYHSSAHFLLYSERAHFFRRTRIKGIRHLIMYAPPSWPHLYPEMINFMQEGNQNPRDGLDTSMTITVLYTKYDILALSSIVSTSKAATMLQSNKRTHLITIKHDL